MHASRTRLPVLTVVYALALLFGTTALAANYTLSLQTTGSGTVVRNPSFAAYPSGATVTVTAIPEAGWSFSHWTGDNNSSVNPLNVLMDGNKSLAAHFVALNVFSVTLATHGQGQVSLNPEGGAYLSNTVVSVSAVPADGWVFTGWGGDASGNANPLSLTVNASKSLTARFAQLPTITTAPTDVSINLGEAAIFEVQAAGAVPLSYAWYFQGALLPDQTGPSLALQNVQLNQEGVYAVVVSNAHGQASASAKLTLLNQCTGNNTVSSTEDLALRQAIAQGGLVKLCFNGTVTLASTIQVSKDVVLDGSGRDIIIRGTNGFRLFEVNSGVKFAVTNVTFTGGRHLGVNGAAATETTAAADGQPGEGGAIFSEGGHVVLSSCTLKDNSAKGGKGGAGPVLPWNDAGAQALARGGAVLVRDGTLVLEKVTAANNLAAGASVEGLPGGEALGGAISVIGGSLQASGCEFQSNACMAAEAANAYGGALHLFASSSTIANGVFTGNLAAGADGMYYIAQGQGNGGAIAIQGGAAVITGSRLVGNKARGGILTDHSHVGLAQGGAVYAGGNVRVMNCLFEANEALAGGGDIDARGGAILNAGSVSVTGSSFLTNSAAEWSPKMDFHYKGVSSFGGALYNLGVCHITNCTLAFNQTMGGFGGGFVRAAPPGDAFGGGIYNAGTGVVTMVNATLAYNSASGKQGAITNGANVGNSGELMQLRNTILAHPGAISNVCGTVTDLGHNISSDDSAAFASGTSFNNTDPLLGVLGTHGGPTLVISIPSASPAVDFGGVEGAPPIDQRGFSRPSGAGPDIGAYEFQSQPSVTWNLNGASAPLQLRFQAEAGLRYILQKSPDMKTWTDVEVIHSKATAAEVSRSLTLTGEQGFFRLVVEE